jgi:hypothetical protein
LYLKSNAANVKGQIILTMLHQNGVPSEMSQTSGVTTFKSTTCTSVISWGYKKFLKRNEFEASECLKDDAFTLKDDAFNQSLWCHNSTVKLETKFG